MKTILIILISILTMSTSASADEVFLMGKSIHFGSMESKAPEGTKNVSDLGYTFSNDDMNNDNYGVGYTFTDVSLPVVGDLDFSLGYYKNSLSNNAFFLTVDKNLYDNKELGLSIDLGVSMVTGYDKKNALRADNALGETYVTYQRDVMGFTPVAFLAISKDVYTTTTATYGVRVVSDCCVGMVRGGLTVVNTQLYVNF